MKKIIVAFIVSLFAMSGAHAKTPDSKAVQMCGYVGVFTAVYYDGLKYREKKDGRQFETIDRLKIYKQETKREIGVWRNEGVHAENDLLLYAYNLMHHANSISAEFPLYRNMDTMALREMYTNRCLVHWDLVIVDYLADQMRPDVQKDMAEGKHLK